MDHNSRPAALRTPATFLGEHVPDTSLTDPLGRTIVLHNHTWFGHIIRNHADMRPYRRLTEAAVTNPIDIRFHPTDANTRLYFGDGPRPGMMVLVAADVVRGFVKTSHLTRQLKGAPEWSRPTP